MSDRDIPYNSDQLPPPIGIKPGEIHCYFPKEEQRAPLLSDDEVIEAWKREITGCGAKIIP